MKYSGHRINALRDFTKANYNLGSKDMVKALINASLEEQGGVKSNTHQARLPAIRLFGEFIKKELGVKRLNYIEQSHLFAFGEYLRDKFEAKGELTASSARDYLSHINCVLAQARGDESLTINATKDLLFPPKSGIALKDGSVAEGMHNDIVQSSSTEVALIARLQRTWGMRFREAALFNASKALKQVNEHGQIEISRGTKGGQTRWVPLENPTQKKILEDVAHYQAAIGHDSLVPKETSFKAFQSMAWRETKAVAPQYLSHGERKTFATNYYERHVGAACPVRSGATHGAEHYRYLSHTLSITIEEAKARDKAVRLQLSKILGHHRLSICNAYLG
ncbi:integrase domain-containing protein [Vibrio sp. FNV 38]|nr:integrase domain-containing protein [Vibrio sp. FNV 38]